MLRQQKGQASQTLHRSPTPFLADGPDIFICGLNCKPGDKALRSGARCPARGKILRPRGCAARPKAARKVGIAANSIRLQTRGNLFEFRGEIDRPSVRTAPRQSLENRQHHRLRQPQHRPRGTRRCRRRPGPWRGRTIFVIWRVCRRSFEISPDAGRGATVVRRRAGQHELFGIASGDSRRRPLRLESRLARRRGETRRPAAP